MTMGNDAGLILRLFDESISVADFAELSELPLPSVRQQLLRGLTPEEILRRETGTPSRRALAEAAGISIHAVKQRLRRGMSPAEIAATPNRKPVVDWTGARIGKLVVQSIAPGRRTKSWLCLCDCGRTSIVATHYLKTGKTRSCGCARIARKHARKIEHEREKPERNLPAVSLRRTYEHRGERLTIEELARRAGVSTGTIRGRLYKGISPSDPGILAPQKRPRALAVRIGDRFGSLTVRAEGPPTAQGRRTARCECVCGAARDVLIPNLVRGIITSCGCRYGRSVECEQWAGQTVGRLTIIGVDHELRSARYGPRLLASVRCRCSCGNTVMHSRHAIKAAKAAGRDLMCGPCREAKRAGRSRRAARSGDPSSGVIIARGSDRGADAVAQKPKQSRPSEPPKQPKQPKPPKPPKLPVERKKNLVGRRFGRLLVEGLDEREKRHRMQRWRCVCDCGQERSVLQCHLVTGKIRSCGCIRRCHDLFGIKLTIGELTELAGASRRMVAGWLRAGMTAEDCLHSASSRRARAARTKPQPTPRERLERMQESFDEDYGMLVEDYDFFTKDAFVPAARAVFERDAPAHPNHVGRTPVTRGAERFPRRR